jgi:dihydroorotate dehydrogenase electron transfer subunit
MKQIIAPVISNSEIIPETYLMSLEAPDIATAARPGQFVMVYCGEDTRLRRPLSVHQVDGNKLALLFTVVGRGTRWLSQRKPGDTIDILGPLGNGYTIYPDSKNLLLVAGGIGIAPLRFLADVALSQGHSVTLLYGTANEHQYPESYMPRGIGLYTATEDGTKGKKGMVTDLLHDFIEWADQIFVCGPIAMYRDMYARRKELLKNKPTQISLEIMMGCGVGVCYGCSIRTKRGMRQVCKDGPVFEMGEMEWGEDC